MLLAILLSEPLPVATPGTAKVGAICKNPEAMLAARKGEPPRLRSLGEEPPAQHILAVLRTDFDGCVKPVVVNVRVGKR